MLSIETDTDELLKAIDQLICILIAAGFYPDEFWTLLALEDILQHLYIRKEI